MPLSWRLGWIRHRGLGAQTADVLESLPRDDVALDVASQDADVAAAAGQFDQDLGEANLAGRESGQDGLELAGGVVDDVDVRDPRRQHPELPGRHQQFSDQQVLHQVVENARLSATRGRDPSHADTSASSRATTTLPFARWSISTTRGYTLRYSVTTGSVLRSTSRSARLRA